MIISQTPLRISFVGGGTDLRDFWSIKEGKVLSSTIDKYVYVIVKERFDDLIVLNYSKREIVERVSDIQHELIRESMKLTGIEKGVEITTLADIPSEGSGLGSSSSITVGLLNTFHQFMGNQVTAEQLAQEACQIEIDILGKPIGKQDQYITAYGGLKEITFLSNGAVTVDKVKLSNSELRALGSNILLFFTNITRKSSEILSEQKKETYNRMDILTRMKNQVVELRTIIESGGDLKKIGTILDETWELKKQLTTKITKPMIDEMYNIAKRAGALGGKISGAGGGGFLMLFVPREKQNAVRTALKDYRELPFMLEPSGSRILLNNRRDYWK